MTNLELVLNMPAKATTSEISKEKHPKSFDDIKWIDKQVGKITGNTRLKIEKNRQKSCDNSKYHTPIQRQEQYLTD